MGCVHGSDHNVPHVWLKHTVMPLCGKWHRSQPDALQGVYSVQCGGVVPLLPDTGAAQCSFCALTDD